MLSFSSSSPTSFFGKGSRKKSTTTPSSSHHPNQLYRSPTKKQTLNHNNAGIMKGLRTPRGGHQQQHHYNNNSPNSQQVPITWWQFLVRLYARNLVMFTWTLIAIPATLWTTQWRNHVVIVHQQQQQKDGKTRQLKTPYDRSNINDNGNVSKRIMNNKIPERMISKDLLSLSASKDNKEDDGEPILDSEDNIRTATKEHFELSNQDLEQQRQQQQQQQQQDQQEDKLNSRPKQDQEQQQQREEFMQHEQQLLQGNDESSNSGANGRMMPSFFTDSNEQEEKGKSVNKIHYDLLRLEPSIYPIIPADIYEPNSLNPLQVIYAGVVVANEAPAKKNNNNNSRGNKAGTSDDESSDESIIMASNKTSLLFDGLEHSKYIQPVATFTYHFQQLATITAKTTTTGSSTSSAEIEKNTTNDYSTISSSAYTHHQYTQEFVQKDIRQASIHNLTPVVIIADWAGLRRDCHILQTILNQIYNQYSYPNKNNNFRIVLIDSSASTRIVNQCPFTGIPTHNDELILVKRSIVDGRYWDQSKQWVESGQLILNNQNDEEKNKRILRLPLSLSETWVAQFHNAVQLKYGKLNVDYTDFVIDVHDQLRTIDVSILYSGESTYYSFLRKRIRTVVQELFRDDKMETIKSVASLKISPDEVEPTTLMAQLMASKIVVLTQSDEWEGDDNNFYTKSGSLLLQVMASGALVLCDMMIAVPDGLRHKTNIIFYDSPESLDELIKYYLQQPDKRHKIAKHGLQTALGRHRVWHSMETLLFGKALTRTDKYWEKAPKPRYQKLMNNTNNSSIIEFEQQ